MFFQNLAKIEIKIGHLAAVLKRYDILFYFILFYFILFYFIYLFIYFILFFFAEL